MESQEERFKKAITRRKIYQIIMTILIIVLMVIIYWDVIFFISTNNCNNSSPRGVLLEDRLSEEYIFNSKFEAYIGERIRGNNIKQLCKMVQTNNIENANDKLVKVGIALNKKDNKTYSNSDPDNLVNQKGEFGTEYDKINSGSTYQVQCNYNNSGLVQSITIVKNKN